MVSSDFRKKIRLVMSNNISSLKHKEKIKYKYNRVKQFGGRRLVQPNFIFRWAAIPLISMLFFLAQRKIKS